MNDLISRFTSRKFISAIMAFAIVVMSGFGVSFPAGVVQASALALVGYIGVEGAVDAVTTYRGKEE